MSPHFGILCFLLLHTGVQGFGILPGDSVDHLEITESAILNVTVQVCRSLAQAEGTDFTVPPEPFTSETVAVACGAQQSSKSFKEAIRVITLRNVRVDIRHALNASFHFDDEMFSQGRRIIATELQAVKASNKQENFEAARKILGKIMHPLQDFYSHSNWVELGKTQPNANLLQLDASIGNIAAISRATCQNCDGDNCTNNILQDIIEEQILTSGYFDLVPLLSTKPAGKCSHGGAVDQTSLIEPTGGINKDSFTASHGHLHREAANMATAATSQLLEDVRRDAGDRPFLQMIGISRGSSKALCFVIDTTSSMREDIETVKQVTGTIINTEVGTENEPSLYILVPFNDPDFGPEIKTTEPNVFKNAINSLSAAGGGDKEEMILSALRLALTAAPKNSEIFVFTDAPAKDKELKSAIIALIERTQTVINFFITESSILQRLKRGEATMQRHDRITESELELYRDLAQTSGGQAIEVTKSDLQAATNIITETTSPSLVTLLQAGRSPGRAGQFSFVVDETVTNLVVFITGRTITCSLTGPRGESWQCGDATGSLVTSSQSVGNFQTLKLAKQVGTWVMAMASEHPYTLKVIGQSPIDFLFDFVEASNGPFGGFDALDTRPRAGVNGSMLVSLTGSESANVSEVALVDSAGSGQINGVVERQQNGNFLVRFDTMSSAPFGVRLTGQDGSGSSSVFQRQSPINSRASNLTITAEADSILVPGRPFVVPFNVIGNGMEGNLIIRATNNRGFTSTFPTSLNLETRGTANDTVTLSAPLNTPSGTDVTLTIEAEATEAADSNYVVLQFSVINSVTDFTKPVCQLVSLQSNCSFNCSLASWTLSVRVSDGAEGTGVASVTLKQGDGSLSTTPDAGNQDITMVSYRASCCSPDVELQVEDRVENKDTCVYSARQGSQDALSGSIQVSVSPFLGLLALWLQVLLGFR